MSTTSAPGTDTSKFSRHSVAGGGEDRRGGSARRLRPGAGVAFTRASASAGWVLRGVGRAAPVLFVTAAITFLLSAFAKQEPADILLGEAATPEAVAELNHELGRDRPLVIQFGSWILQAVQGDLGTSWFTGIPVLTTIADRMPVSLSIAGLALVIAVVLGASAGIAAALLRDSWIDRLVTLAASTLATLPPFVVSIGLILLFGVALPILPTGGYVPFERSPGGWLASIVLPAIALSLEAAADLARQLRTALVRTYEENLVIGARLRGLSPARILIRHALPHASGPALAALGIQVPRLVGGAIIAEQIFSLPGLGLMAYEGAMQGDQPVVLGSVMVTVVVVLVSTLVVDLLILALNPAARTSPAAPTTPAVRTSSAGRSIPARSTPVTERSSL